MNFTFDIQDKQLEMRAMVFAYAAHAAVGQVRKYTKEPYILHPAAVVDLVRGVEHTPEMLATAWLHDVVEDTKITLEHITQVFGEEISRMVYYVTDVSLEEGSRRIRKAKDRARIAEATWHVKTVKLADLIDNTSTIQQYDPDFASLYMREKRELLEVLRDGSPQLWGIANNIVQSYFTLHPEHG